MKYFFYLLICFVIFQSTQTFASCWEKPVISQTQTTFILAMGANIGEIQKANSDALALAGALQKRFRVPDSNTCVLENVTRGDFKRALEHLQKLVRKQDRVFIYFSGHGTKTLDDNNDENNNLTDCYDEAFVIFDNKISRKPDFITDDHFVKQVNKINTNHIITVIDSCFSGGMLRGTQNCLDMKSKLWFMDDKSDALPGKDCPSTNIKRLQGTAYMASKEYQLAWEFDKGGVFTTFFIENMQNNPNAELNKIFDRTAKQVSRKTNQGDCEQLQEPQRQP
jgi:hypothetical protein